MIRSFKGISPQIPASCYVDQSAQIIGDVVLAEYVTVGHSVTLHGCAIGDRCLIGMGAIILNGAWIGADSIIAAGTLITEKTVVEAGSLWMGSPGKFRRMLTEKDQESIMRY